jgi:glycerol transport system ATP-binding protein
MGVRLSGIGKTVDGVVHLHDIDLDLPAGTFCVVLGATLAGKTSLLRLVAGLDEPTVGQVERVGRVAMVYQEFVNYPSMTVAANIASPLRAQRLGRAGIDARVREAAADLGLDGLLDRLPEQLSGGQQQRTALARALVSGAEVVLLDEPLANLDASLRGALREQIRESFASREAVVLYATHDPGEALWFGGLTVAMHEGRVLQVGSARELYERPACLEVARIMSAPPINAWEVVLEGAGDGTGDGTGEGTGAGTGIRLPTGVCFPAPGHMRAVSPGPYILAARPHRLSLSSSARNTVPLPVKLDLAEIDGSVTLLHTHQASRDGSPSQALPILARERGVHPHALGGDLVLHLDPGACFLFSRDGRLAAAPSVLVESVPVESTPVDKAPGTP